MLYPAELLGRDHAIPASCEGPGIAAKRGRAAAQGEM